MSTKPRIRISPEEYLALERRADGRSEWVDDEVFALAGASFVHSLITGNVVAALKPRLRGRGCTVHPSDLRVHVERGGMYYYPDVVVVCGPPQFVDGEKDTVTNPTLVVEVLSPSTEGWDRGAKFARYRRLDSLREVLFVAQDQIRVERYLRQPDGFWLLAEYGEETGDVIISTLDVLLPLAEVYEGVAFPKT